MIIIDDDPIEAIAEQLAERILALKDEKNPALLLYALSIATAKSIHSLAHNQAHAADGVAMTSIDLADRVNELFGPQYPPGNA